MASLTDRDFRQRLAKLSGACCGEDSYSVSENDEQLVIAIADGVGGWRKRGVDPAKFSRCIMDQVGKLVGDAAKLSGVLLKTEDLLAKAFSGLVQVYRDGKGEPFGSSTVCIVSLQKRQGILEVCNLGDSGAIVIRDGAIIYRSVVQQTRFNAPYQTTLRPNGEVNDMTPMASRDRLHVQPGDMVLLATDGLWDNVWERDLLETVASGMAGLSRKEGGLSVLAKDLVMQARAAAAAEDDSPFAVESRKHDKPHTGGKPDDITVLVAVVEEQS